MKKIINKINRFILRNYFAGKAMQAIFTQHNHFVDTEKRSIIEEAKILRGVKSAYLIAEYMLDVKNKSRKYLTGEDYK